MEHKILTLLGPTAVGKTALAVQIAAHLGGEIISADSRQVFRGMDIGTGKDLSDYWVDNKPLPYHLIDIAEAGTEYNLFHFVKDFEAALQTIYNQDKWAVLCGGTGLYLDAVLRGYRLQEVPENKELREKLAGKSQAGLVEILATYRPLHSTTDNFERERTLRAIEIEDFKQKNPQITPSIDLSGTPVFGLYFDRETIRSRISERLKSRLEQGLIAEVQQLLDSGVTESQLLLYGLEYKFITLYLQQKLAYAEMFGLLETAIHQFAKRQTTWFRRMEKNGVQIHWLQGTDGIQTNTEKILKSLINN